MTQNAMSRGIVSLFFSFVLFLGMVSCKTDILTNLEVDNLKTSEGPVFFQWDQRFPPDSLRILMNGQTVPFQVDQKGGAIWFWAQSKDSAYTVVKSGGDTHSITTNKIHDDSGNRTLSMNDHPYISYRYEMKYPPDGVDSLFAKSGYIHPLMAPNGDTLTRIQPPDHYHHYGIWGPWTHARIDGRLVDFWNIGDGTGTVLFKEFTEKEVGALYTSFTARQEHLDLLAQVERRLAIVEDLTIRLWRPEANGKRYMVDYTSAFSTPLDSAVLLEAYRYGGGLGFRATEKWGTDNSFVLTSEGKDRKTADGTNARWCIVGGESSTGTEPVGILFLSHPENQAHPEPMRVWPEDMNDGKGNVFFEFSPIRHHEWVLHPQETYRLNYRMVVFQGELSATEAEAYWQAFVNPPKSKIIENQ